MDVKLSLPSAAGVIFHNETLDAICSICIGPTSKLKQILIRTNQAIDGFGQIISAQKRIRPSAEAVFDKSLGLKNESTLVQQPFSTNH